LRRGTASASGLSSSPAFDPSLEEWVIPVGRLAQSAGASHRGRPGFSCAKRSRSATIQEWLTTPHRPVGGMTRSQHFLSVRTTMSFPDSTCSGPFINEWRKLTLPSNLLFLGSPVLRGWRQQYRRGSNPFFRTNAFAVDLRPPLAPPDLRGCTPAALQLKLLAPGRRVFLTRRPDDVAKQADVSIEHESNEQSGP
jgi:hypothetical protein